MRYVLFIFYYGLLKINGYAQPVLNAPDTLGGRVVLRDKETLNIYYYLPGELTLAAEKNGHPAFTLLMTRYTGSQLSGDQRASKFNSLLQLKIQLNDHRDSLNYNLSKHTKQKIRLLPLNLTNIKTRLVFQDADGLSQELTGGGFETIHSVTSALYWPERLYTIKLSNTSAQLLEEQLKKGITSLSFEYVFETSGVILNKTLQTEIAKNNLGISGSDKPFEEVHNFPILTNTFNVNIDHQKHPETIRKIDINASRLPANYAFLEVRCYVFKESLNVDLDARKIELEAHGVGAGTKVKQSLIFSKLTPDVVSQHVRFPYAIRTDMPLKYRLMDITSSNQPPLYSEWKELTDWYQVLDITR